MAYASLMGLLKPRSLLQPPCGFNVPVYRVYGDRGEMMLLPRVVNDRVLSLHLYTMNDVFGPVWSNDRLEGATHIISGQPGLYAFLFPDGRTYVAVKELMVAALREWLQTSEAMAAGKETLQEALDFCGTSLPFSLRRQVKIIQEMPVWAAV